MEETATTTRDKKRCPNCQKILLLSEFHRNKSRPDGYMSECKECARERSREYSRKKYGHRALLPRLSPEERENYKRCPTCQAVKTLDKFYVVKSRTDGHDYQCKLCHNTRKREAKKRKKLLSPGEEKALKRIVRIENKINADDNRKLDNLGKKYVIERVDIRSKSNKPLPIDDVMDNIKKLYPTVRKRKR